MIYRPERPKIPIRHDQASLTGNQLRGKPPSKRCSFSSGGKVSRCPTGGGIGLVVHPIRVYLRRWVPCPCPENVGMAPSCPAVSASTTWTARDRMSLTKVCLGSKIRGFSGSAGSDGNVRQGFSWQRRVTRMPGLIWMSMPSRCRGYRHWPVEPTALGSCDWMAGSRDCFASISIARCLLGSMRTRC